MQAPGAKFKAQLQRQREEGKMQAPFFSFCSFTSLLGDFCGGPEWLRTCLPVHWTRFNAWSWKISHAAEQLSWGCTTTVSPHAATAEALVP